MNVQGAYRGPKTTYIFQRLPDRWGTERRGESEATDGDDHHQVQANTGEGAQVEGVGDQVDAQDGQGHLGSGRPGHVPGDQPVGEQMQAGGQRHGLGEVEGGDQGAQRRVGAFGGNGGGDKQQQRHRQHLLVRCRFVGMKKAPHRRAPREPPVGAAGRDVVVGGRNGDSRPGLASAASAWAPAAFAWVAERVSSEAPLLTGRIIICSALRH